MKMITKIKVLYNGNNKHNIEKGVAFEIYNNKNKLTLNDSNLE